MRLPRVLFASFLAMTVLSVLVSAPASAGPPQAQTLTKTAIAQAPAVPQIRLTPIGTPIWKPADLHLFSATIGTAASGYVEFCNTSLELLPPPNHKRHPALCVGPGKPHQRPYNKELRAGVSALGFHQDGPFAVGEFSNGNGVWLAWMNVPSPGTLGSSPDFKSGPIIPNRLFPIHVTGFSTHDGKQFSTLADFNVPKLDNKLDPPFFVGGHSHFPMFIVDNRDFAPPGDRKPTGSYTWRLDMVDRQNEGWHIETDFVVGRRGDIWKQAVPGRRIARQEAAPIAAASSWWGWPQPN